MTAAQVPVLIVVVPLLAGLLTTIVGYIKKEWALPVVIGGLAISFGASLKTLGRVLSEGKIQYVLGGWGGWKAPIGIEYVVDHLNAFVLVMVSGVALLTAFTQVLAAILLLIVKEVVNG